MRIDIRYNAPATEKVPEVRPTGPVQCINSDAWRVSGTPQAIQQVTDPANGLCVATGNMGDSLDR
jgi:hypothetical protein